MQKAQNSHNLFLLILLLTSTSCSANTQPPTAISSPTTKISTPLIKATDISIPTVMSQYFQTDGYILKSTIKLGDYKVQSWENPLIDNIWGRSRVSIHVMFQTILIDNAMVGQLPQEDITGEGHPDVIIYSPERVWENVIIYDLGTNDTNDRITRVFDDSIPRDCKFEIKDINNDNIPEIINCDFAFGFFDCGPSWGPMPLIVYSYDSISMRYNVVSPLYPEIYEEAIESSTKLSEKSPTDKCIISNLLMNYFYAGRIDKGWSELSRIYQGQDIDSFQKEMQDLLKIKRRAGRFILLEDLKTK